MWPLWKRVAASVLNSFDLGDHEYIKATFGPWPLRFFITVMEPRYRRRGRPSLRLRCCLASLASSWIFSRCTVCQSRFSLRELLRRDGSLIHFMSGSICHNNCQRKNSEVPSVC